MKFTFEKLESTGSPLYMATAIKNDGDIDFSWLISCDDESKLEEIAKEAYELYKSPKTDYSQNQNIETTPSLEKIIQEQQKMIEQLKADVAALKGEK